MAFVDPDASRQMQSYNESWQRDGKCRATFHKQVVLDERATEGWTEELDEIQDDGTLRRKKVRHAGAGRPIFVEQDYIRIFTPGDPTNVPDREVREDDKAEYSAEWAAYEKGQEQHHKGTPLDQWTQVNRALAEELKYFKIYTVEDLAVCPDVNGQKVAGFQQLKRKAQDFLRAAESAAPLADLRNELEQERKKSADEKQVLLDRLASLEELVKKQAAQQGQQKQPQR